ncbi:hypothetical protein BGI41_02485 [Methanobrevibacter sp. 87.7]|uniref:DUF2115 domain-containing protein n=1 Tax=Methanobrevibacter sp. 87.7 TaxID=387957 RepID=UPI000B513CC4|nr:DUF2115 domain-containing protein [Methanobrevibacter sp. 87.7]OWT33427.1 hypothetical protein BGI41_02485 [Methanobrevibacter sp. 87.7]
MFQELEKLGKNREDSKDKLLEILKDESRKISIYDQMKMINELKESLSTIQKQYREDFFKTYAHGFVVKINKIKNENPEDYSNEKFDIDEYIKSVIILKRQSEEKDEDSTSSEEFRRIYTIISLYTTFILNEPIHEVGTKFPGNLEIVYKNGKYYCPVKKNNENNPKAVCQFCIAENLDY